MTRDEYNNHIKTFFNRGLDIMKKKNADYASESDPFLNFRGATSLGITVEQGILVRMQDKMSRIANLIQRPAQVADEKIEDTLIDLANYSAILHAFLNIHKDYHATQTEQSFTGVFNPETNSWNKLKPKL